MLYTALFTTLLAFSVTARSHSLRNVHSHAQLARRQSSDPSNLAPNSTNTATGCTQFYTVPEGVYCYMVADNYKLSLADFYALNPQIDASCSNLWAGYSYCVAGPTGSNSSAPAEVSITSRKPRVIPSKPTSSIDVTASSTFINAAPSSIQATPAPAPSSKSAPSSSKSASSSSESASSSSQSVQVASSSSESAAPAATPYSGSSVSSFLAKAGVTSFLGQNGNAIASWFRADNAGDSTNGHSWCGFPYSNSDAIFAPDVNTMLNSFGGDYVAAGHAFCGLEAEFTTPDGKTALLYIGDGFDSKWVLTPSSIDVMTGAFPLLFGRQTDNKNDVVQGVTWKFTGKRNNQFAFKGYGY